MHNQFANSELKTTYALRPLPERFSTYLLWGSLVGIAFFSIYPTMNWLTGLGDRHYSLYFAAELRVPFIPRFIWLYLSLYLLLLLPPVFLNPAELRQLAKALISATCLSGVTFLILPAQLGFTRTLPGDELYRMLFQKVFLLDQPYNLVPSLHVVYTTAICFAILAHTRGAIRLLVSIWFVLILLSTIFVHQHHLLDVASGLVLAILMQKFWEGKNV